EALLDEVLQARLLLVQARARQQQHAIAGLQAFDHFAVLEVGEPGLHGHRDDLVTTQRDDPVVAAELIVRDGRGARRGGPAITEIRRAAPKAAGRTAGEAARRPAAVETT